jgi:hypothetical protein
LRSEPTGAWSVVRKWLPHRDGIGVRARFRRKRKRQGDDDKDRWYDYLDPFDGCGGDLGDIAVVIGLIVAFLVLVFVFPPLLLLGIDLVWVALAFVGGIVGRVVLGRPWSVVATSSTGERREWKVRGFRDAGQLRDTLRAEFGAGLDPRPDRLTP